MKKINKKQNTKKCYHIQESDILDINDEDYDPFHDPDYIREDADGLVRCPYCGQSARSIIIELQNKIFKLHKNLKDAKNEVKYIYVDPNTCE